MREVEYPSPCAAAMKFCSRSVIISARVNLAYSAHETIMIPMNAPSIPGPTIATIASTSTMNGIAIVRSARRITKLSRMPA